MMPFGFLVHDSIGNGTQGTNQLTIGTTHHAGECRAGGFVHERHEFVGKSRHGASDANATNVWTSSNSVHPPALGDIAVHHRPPATNLDEAFRRAVFMGEIA